MEALHRAWCVHEVTDAIHRYPEAAAVPACLADRVSRGAPLPSVALVRPAEEPLQGREGKRQRRVEGEEAEATLGFVLEMNHELYREMMDGLSFLR